MKAPDNSTMTAELLLYIEITQYFTKPKQVQQDCSYQGEALNVPTAFEGLWSSSNNIKTLYEIK